MKANINAKMIIPTKYGESSIKIMNNSIFRKSIVLLSYWSCVKFSYHPIVSAILNNLV